MSASTSEAGSHLPLGASDLPESRLVSTLAPGVTLTKIKRGVENPALFWTAEVAIPSDSPDPDAPASALSSQADVRKVADELAAAGVNSSVEQVRSPQLAETFSA